MDLECKVNASLADDSINVLKNVHNGLDLRVQRINPHVGRIYMADAAGNMQPLPAAKTMNDNVVAAVAPCNNEFFYAWVDSFTV